MDVYTRTYGICLFEVLEWRDMGAWCQVTILSGRAQPERRAMMSQLSFPSRKELVRSKVGRHGNSKVGWFERQFIQNLPTCAVPEYLNQFIQRTEWTIQEVWTEKASCFPEFLFVHQDPAVEPATSTLNHQAFLQVSDPPKVQSWPRWLDASTH